MLYDEFAQKYPPEYMVGFYVSDQEAINAYLTYLAIRGAQLEGVVVENTAEGTVVYAQIDDSLEQINWGEPNSFPEDLPGFAETVYQFAGPTEVQQRRAEQLAKRVQGEHRVKSLDEITSDYEVEQLLGRGMILLNQKF